MERALPIYVQIADEIRQNLQQGLYKVGEKLPSEAQLSDRYQVNRHTLRQAIALLKSEGLLRVDRGVGIFVATSPVLYPIGKRVRYNEALQAQGLKGKYQLLRATEILADAKITEKLGLTSKATVALIERLGLANDKPICLVTSYFPLERFPDMIEHWQAGVPSLSKLMRDVYHCDHLRRSTHISARSVKPTDARILGISLNQPILLIESVNVDEHGSVIEYGVARFRGDGMELILENDEF